MTNNRFTKNNKTFRTQIPISIDAFKSIGVLCIIFFQKYFPLNAEIQLSRILLCKSAFVRIRDVMVSHDLKLIYFPIPKSACTLFSTMLALNDRESMHFNPKKEGVHSYRFRTKTLRLNDLSLFHADDYFKFTVIRDPFSRIVSAYLDKIVKPLKTDSIDEKNRNYQYQMHFSLFAKQSFMDVINYVCQLPDHKLDKHWRPQHLFFRNIKLDHIGRLNNIEDTFAKIKKLTGIDICKDVSPLVFDPKRTAYDHKASSKYLAHPSEMSSLQLSQLPSFPPAKAFFTTELSAKINQRYLEDWKLYTGANH